MFQVDPQLSARLLDPKELSMRVMQSVYEDHLLVWEAEEVKSSPIGFCLQLVMVCSGAFAVQVLLG